MEMAYIQAENLKHKRTFTKTLMVLAPFVTALMNFFAPLWFQLKSGKLKLECPVFTPVWGTSFSWC